MQELKVISKCCDLMQWSLPVMGGLSRQHRYVIGQRIEQNMLNVMEQLVRAKYNAQKRRNLEEASIQLDLVRLQVRVLHDGGLIDASQYGRFCEALDEVGRQIGGWMRGRGGERA